MPDPISDLNVLAVAISDRVSYLEQTYLEFLARLNACEESARSAAEVANSVDADRGEYKKRVDVVEAACTSTGDSLKKIDQRLKAVEGAIGGAAKAARDSATAEDAGGKKKASASA